MGQGRLAQGDPTTSLMANSDQFRHPNGNLAETDDLLAWSSPHARYRADWAGRRSACRPCAH